MYITACLCKVVWVLMSLLTEHTVPTLHQKLHASGKASSIIYSVVLMTRHIIAEWRTVRENSQSL